MSAFHRPTPCMVVSEADEYLDGSFPNAAEAIAEAQRAIAEDWYPELPVIHVRALTAPFERMATFHRSEPE